MFIKFNIRYRDIRTSVTLNQTSVQLLALQLDVTPANIRQGVEAWLQHRTDTLHNQEIPHNDGLSQWLQSQLILELVSEELRERYRALFPNE